MKWLVLGRMGGKLRDLLSLQVSLPYLLAIMSYWYCGKMRGWWWLRWRKWKSKHWHPIKHCQLYLSWEVCVKKIFEMLIWIILLECTQLNFDSVGGAVLSCLSLCHRRGQTVSHPSCPLRFHLFITICPQAKIYINSIIPTCHLPRKIIMNQNVSMRSTMN